MKSLLPAALLACLLFVAASDTFTPPTYYELRIAPAGAMGTRVTGVLDGPDGWKEVSKDGSNRFDTKATLLNYVTSTNSLEVIEVLHGDANNQYLYILRSQ